MSYRGVELPNIKNENMRQSTFDPYANRGRIGLTCIRHAKKGRAAMGRNMQNIYADMLTKELVALRTKHKNTCAEMAGRKDKKGIAEYDRCAELVAQINEELANRVAMFGLQR